VVLLNPYAAYALMGINLDTGEACGLVEVVGLSGLSGLCVCGWCGWGFGRCWFELVEILGESSQPPSNQTH